MRDKRSADDPVVEASVRRPEATIDLAQNLAVNGIGQRSTSVEHRVLGISVLETPPQLLDKIPTDNLIGHFAESALGRFANQSQT